MAAEYAEIHALLDGLVERLEYAEYDSIGTVWHGDAVRARYDALDLLAHVAGVLEVIGTATGRGGERDV